MTLLRLAFAVILVLGGMAAASANEPNWTGPIVKRGIDRVQTQQKSIESRPYRPLHFYGNTIRRMHYRGQVLPRPHDVVQGSTAFVTRR